MKFATKLIHNGHAIDPATGALGVPICQTSTFRQESIDHFGRYDYSRSGNPTREALEEAVALLENGSHGLAFASGMAAISSTLLLFSPGDHLVVCEDVYGGTYRVLTTVFARLGITCTFVDATDTEKIASAISAADQGALSGDPVEPAYEDHRSAGCGGAGQEHDLAYHRRQHFHDSLPCSAPSISAAISSCTAAPNF